jgi:hypothetical protein
MNLGKKVSQKKFFDKLCSKILREEELLLNSTKQKLHATNMNKKLTSRIYHLENHLKKFRNDEPIIKLLEENIQEVNTYREILNQPERELVSKMPKSCTKESCNGIYIKNKCSICNDIICNKCFSVITNDEHECDSDILETLKFIKKDSKPCPKCSVPIHKIDGCDQMFCVTCHTAFSWRTCKIQNGVIHNPHYFQWLRENNNEIPRQMGDLPADPCNVIANRAITLLEIEHRRDNNIQYPDESFKKMCKELFFSRILREIHVSINNITIAQTIESIDAKKQALRIKFIKNDNMKQWKISLRLLLKRLELWKECQLLLETFDQEYKNQLIRLWENRLDDTYIPLAPITEFSVSIIQLVAYFNAQTQEIKDRHGLVSKLKIDITDSYRLVSPWL